MQLRSLPDFILYDWQEALFLLKYVLLLQMSGSENCADVAQSVVHRIGSAGVSSSILDISILKKQQSQFCRLLFFFLSPFFSSDKIFFENFFSNPRFWNQADVLQNIKER